MPSQLGDWLEGATTRTNGLARDYEVRTSAVKLRRWKCRVRATARNDMVSPVGNGRVKGDYAKTGVLYLMPTYISKYGRPLPYFMRYASDYYARQQLAKTQSNMNRLCLALEKWEKRMRWRRRKSGFDWTVMIDDSIEVDEKTLMKVEDIYQRFCADVKELSKKLSVGYSKETLNEMYGQCYESYRSECRLVCPDRRKLANAVVKLSYEMHPTWSQKFMWVMASSGIVANIKQVDIELPVRDPNGEEEYLGRRYSMAVVSADSEVLKEAFN